MGQLTRLGKLERSQDKGIDQREIGDEGSDPHRQGQDDGETEFGCAAERTNGQTEVL